MSGMWIVDTEHDGCFEGDRLKDCIWEMAEYAVENHLKHMDQDTYWYGIRSIEWSGDKIESRYLFGKKILAFEFALEEAIELERQRNLEEVQYHRDVACDYYQSKAVA